jgi:hypothetical protein
MLLPLLMAIGVGLTIINTRAVLEAIFGIQTAFARTPKYAVGGKPVRLEHTRYRSKSGWLPYAELAIGTYFLGMVMYAIETYNFLTVPFLLLFVVGYYWAGIATLQSEYQSRLKWMEQRRLSLKTAQ